MNNRFYLDEVPTAIVETQGLKYFIDILAQLGCNNITLFGKKGNDGFNPLLNIKIEFVCPNTKALNPIFPVLKKYLNNFCFYQSGDSQFVILTPLLHLVMNRDEIRAGIAAAKNKESKSEPTSFEKLSDAIRNQDQLEQLRTLIETANTPDTALECTYLKTVVAQAILDPGRDFEKYIENANRLCLPFAYFIIGKQQNIFRKETQNLLTKLASGLNMQEMEKLQQFESHVPDNKSSIKTAESSSRSHYAAGGATQFAPNGSNNQPAREPLTEINIARLR